MAPGTNGGMSPAAFREWMERMGWSQAETARQLGVSRPSVRLWSGSGAGAAKSTGTPKHIALACAELERREQQGESK